MAKRKPGMGDKELAFIRRPNAQVNPVNPVDNVSHETSVNTSRSGLRAGWRRKTYIQREAYIDAIERDAYWSRRRLWEILDEMFAERYTPEMLRSLKPIPENARRPK